MEGWPATSRAKVARGALRAIVERHGGHDRGLEAVRARDGVMVYRFRQHDPRRYKPGTFRTATITPHVALVYAQPKTRKNPPGPVVHLRPNPLPLELRPHWQPLRRGGKLSLAVRDQTRGKTGVYAIREAKATAPMLYIGETHEAAPTELLQPKRRKGERKRPPPVRRLQPRRWWKTILRHLYPWEWRRDPRDPRSPQKRPDEWVYRGSHDLDIALWPTEPANVKELEGRIILETKRDTEGREPLHNRLAFVSDAELAELDAQDELEPAPF
jgi:hypothetical protein